MGITYLVRRFLSLFRKNYSKPYKTNRGETVKSGGEKRIADYFHRYGIKYEYERQLRFGGFLGFNSKKFRPDFYLPDFNLYIEYCGLRGQTEYDRTVNYKKRMYRKHSVRIVYIYPTELRDLHFVLKRKSEKYLEGKNLLDSVHLEK